MPPTDHGMEGPEILAISTRREGAHGVVELEGELDPSCSDRFDHEIRRLLADADPVDSIEIHAPRLRFIDSGGLVAVLRARAEAEEAGVGCYLSEVSPQVRDLVRITGLETVLLPPSEITASRASRRHPG